MTRLQEHLSERPYPGRLILLGQTAGGEEHLLAYALTGRSPSSQARQLVQDKEGSLSTALLSPPSSPTRFGSPGAEEGRPSLLLYPCVRRFHDLWLVSNGAQTRLLEEVASSRRQRGEKEDPLALLVAAGSRSHWVPGDRPGEWIDLARFEPDSPHFTPRIQGALRHDGAALSLVKHSKGRSIRLFYDFPLSPGEGRLLSTYAGPLVSGSEPLPPFVGEPLALQLPASSPEELAHEVYEALAPSTITSSSIEPAEPGEEGEKEEKESGREKQQGERGQEESGGGEKQRSGPGTEEKGTSEPDLRVAVGVIFCHNASGKVRSYLLNRHKS